MKKKIVSFVPYAAVLAIAYYLLPLIVKNTGMAMIIMLFILPFITLAVSVIYGIRHGFSLLIPIISVLLFAPTIFIFYNSSAWIYIMIYAVISLLGNMIGRTFNKK